MRPKKNRDYDQMIHARQWLILRKQKLTDSPYCERCGKPAVLVHHVTPVETSQTKEGMRTLMYSYANLQSLCSACHDQIHKELGSKSRQENIKRKEAEANEFIRKLFKNEGI